DLVPLQLLKESAAADTRRLHTLTDDPAAADLILFAECHDDDAAAGRFLEHVRTDPAFRAHPRRGMVHSGMDPVIPVLPGVHPSTRPRWHRPGWTHSGCYLARKHPDLQSAAPVRDPHRPHLASFVGCAKGKPVRERLMPLASSPRFLAIDATDEFLGAIRAGDGPRLRDLKRRYIDSLAQALFALCPGGEGPSSIRLFEAMELGIAPVI